MTNIELYGTATCVNVFTSWLNDVGKTEKTSTLFGDCKAAGRLLKKQIKCYSKQLRKNVTCVGIVSIEHGHTYFMCQSGSYIIPLQKKYLS